ncbi:DUF4436 family protein [Streptomyces sp. NPDC001941]|uniref:DUF4436 family protein n=1 Tax=Streptomyces sp. NPDC001941 TaxID=3154659 RepID=UPI00333219A4
MSTPPEQEPAPEQAPGPGSNGDDGRSRRRSFARWAVLLAVLGVLCGSGVWAYHAQRQDQQGAVVAGDARPADRIELYVSVERIDPAGQYLTLRVGLEPKGRYAEDGSDFPVEKVTVATASDTQRELTFPAHQAPVAREVSIPLSGGTIADYPFDRYQADLSFLAVVGTGPAPTLVEVTSTDPFYRLHKAKVTREHGAVYLTETVTRSRGTILFACFMMAAMWAIALSVLTATWVVVSQRRGLVWPAMGWMAASLFALVGLRNAAPGTPPIGALPDYAAFFWAELIIAGALVATTAYGAHAETRPAPPAAPAP